MATPAELILAFFRDAQPTLKLPDGTWWGSRPNDVMHTLSEVRVGSDRAVIELNGNSSFGARLRFVLDGAVTAEEVCRPGVHDLRITGFGRCVLEEPTRTWQWHGGVITFVRWSPQGQVPPSVLG